MSHADVVLAELRKNIDELDAEKRDRVAAYTMVFKAMAQQDEECASYAIALIGAEMSR